MGYKVLVIQKEKDFSKNLSKLLRQTPITYCNIVGSTVYGGMNKVLWKYRGRALLRVKWGGFHTQVTLIWDLRGE